MIKKKCKTCLETKSMEELFYKNEKMKSGYANECKSCISIRRKNNKLNHRKNQQKYAKNNPDKIKKKSKDYYHNNKESENIRSKNWRDNNKSHIRQYNNERRKNNPLIRFNEAFRSSFRKSLKGKKSGKTFDNLPYSQEELKFHFEKQFTEDMNWENYGTFWHIDHIVPLAYYSPKGEKDPNFLKAWSLANLQPLEASKNISKNSFHEGKRHFYKK